MDPKLKKLLEQRSKKMDDIGEILNGQDSETRMTPEIVTRVEDMQKEVTVLNKEIDIRKSFLETTKTSLEGNPDIAVKIEEERQIQQAADESTDEQRRLNVQVNDDNRNKFQSLGHQMIAIAQHARNAGTRSLDPRLLYWNNKNAEDCRASGMSVGTPADGGHAIAPDFIPILLERAEEGSVLLPLVTRLKTNSGVAVLPYFDESSRATGSRMGGVRVYRKKEGADATASAPKIGLMTCTIDKLMGFLYMTDELLEDAPLLESYAGIGFENEFGWMIDNEIMNGNGSGECLGILKSDALVNVAKETDQKAATILHKNLVQMKKRIWLRSRKNAIWLANQDIEDQLEELNIPVGTGGSIAPKYSADSIKPGIGKLMNFPIHFMEQSQTLGTKGDIIFMDPKQYLLFERPGIKFAVSIHLQFLADETAFRWTWRINGQPAWRTSKTPANGSNTLSPFISLATRS